MYKYPTASFCPLFNPRGGGLPSTTLGSLDKNEEAPSGSTCDELHPKSVSKDDLKDGDGRQLAQSSFPGQKNVHLYFDRVHEYKTVWIRIGMI